ncbi:MAG: DUF5805 domain-containing protein [Haloarculaceae archaeon]
MATEEVDATRTTVKTYVPAYQRAAWDGHADDLDMSRSEFVRSMVQAGRRGFGDEEAAAPDSAGPDSDTPPEAGETAESAVGDGDDQRPFETRILNALSKSEYLSWDELVETVTSDIEGQLETTVQDLQADNLVRYSGPNGGYTIDE